MKMIKTLAIISCILITIPTTNSCKAVAKAAVKHWTKKQKKKFIAKCKDGALDKFGEKANDICSCVAGIAEEKYPDINDAMNIKVFEIIKMASDCK